MPTSVYSDHVFINCPFDDQYKPLFNAIVFAIHDCGFVARCWLRKMKMEAKFGLIRFTGLLLNPVMESMIYQEQN